MAVKTEIDFGFLIQEKEFWQKGRFRQKILVSFALYREGVIIKKRENFGAMSELGLTPPSLPYRIFWSYLKMLTPPLGSISDIIEFENILMTEDPPD